MYSKILILSSDVDVILYCEFQEIPEIHFLSSLKKDFIQYLDFLKITEIKFLSSLNMDFILYLDFLEITDIKLCRLFQHSFTVLNFLSKTPESERFMSNKILNFISKQNYFKIDDGNSTK